MTLVGWSQIVLVLALVVACSVPLSAYIARLYAGERTFLSSVLGPVERGLYRLAGVNPAREQDWFAYTVAMVVFSVAGFLSLYALQRLQNFLPLNPRGFDAVAARSRLQHLEQLHHQHELAELQRRDDDEPSDPDARPHRAQFRVGRDRPCDGFRARARLRPLVGGDGRQFLGRYDPGHAYILLPISIVGALVLVALGVPQTLAGAVDATTLEGAKQTISIGPVASQEIIKELGTNGGGFFNANSAHPFENPNAWTNLLEIWALLLIPTASVLAFGRAVGDMRQGWAILAAMAVFFIVGVGVAYWSETAGNPILTALGVDPLCGQS